MRSTGLLVVIIFFSLPAAGQSFLEAMFDAERAFEQAVERKGVNSAFLEFLSEDAIIFKPEPVNGPEFLRKRDRASTGALRRKVSFADVSTNGLLGYTTGEWTLTQKVKTLEIKRMGQYATVWQKRPDGRYKAILDIEISHDPYEISVKPRDLPDPKERDTNKRRWSAADATMNFLRLSMTKEGLGGAYDKFAGGDVRLLRDGLPPIDGRKAAEKEMEKYVAIDFPPRVSQFETADMAYSWNPCSYSNSNEGMEKGNCLHIWKLRDTKWRIVLGVFARVANDKVPELKARDRPKR